MYFDLGRNVKVPPDSAHVRRNRLRRCLRRSTCHPLAISCPGPPQVYIECSRLRQAPGHQLATLQLHSSSANIMASMEVFDLMEQQFLAARHDFMSTGAGELGTEAKTQNAPRRCAEELVVGVRGFVCLFVVILVAGAGFEPAAFRL